MKATDGPANLNGLAVIVTGAGRGIGRAIALRLARDGMPVALSARSVDQIDETRRMIESAGGRAIGVAGDVTSESHVTELVSRTAGAFGRIGALVNNAGVAPLSPIQELKAETFDELIATNIRAVHLCTRAVWRHFCEHGGGAIVNISSMAAFDAFPGFAAYGAAKAFVNAYTKSLATEGAASRIRVYAVAPGAVETQMLRGPFPDFPRGQTLAPDDVAEVVQNLLSPACYHMSGQVVMVKRN